MPAASGQWEALAGDWRPREKEKVGASVLPAPSAQLLLPPSDLQAQGHSGGLLFLVSGSPLRSLNPAHISFI